MHRLNKIAADSEISMVILYDDLISPFCQCVGDLLRNRGHRATAAQKKIIFFVTRHMKPLSGVTGIVNLAARGMLVVSVARRLGSEGPLLAYCAARSNQAGPQKGALGPLS
jgi:hypothetical protein